MRLVLLITAALLFVGCADTRLRSDWVTFDTGCDLHRNAPIRDGHGVIRYNGTHRVEQIHRSEPAPAPQPPAEEPVEQPPPAPPSACLLRPMCPNPLDALVASVP